MGHGKRYGAEQTRNTNIKTENSAQPCVGDRREKSEQLGHREKYFLAGGERGISLTGGMAREGLNHIKNRLKRQDVNSLHHTSLSKRGAFQTIGKEWEGPRKVFWC